MSGFDIPGPADLRPHLIGEDQIQEPKVPGSPSGEPSTFAKTLTSVLTEVRELQLDSKQKYQALARGENVEVHDLMIAMGKSEVAFNLMLEVRNKLLEAWQHLSRSVS